MNRNNPATARIDLRVTPEMKSLVERAATANGQSVSALINQLLRTEAPKILAASKKIHLSNHEFDKFIALCQNENWTIPTSLTNLAQEMDEEGFKWR